MNQILDYNPNKSSGSGKSSGTDNIVRIFAVILVVFALVLVGSGLYGMYKNNQKAGEDDIDTADVFLSISTGSAPTYIALTTTVLAILGTGIILIKKFVL